MVDICKTRFGFFREEIYLSSKRRKLSTAYTIEAVQLVGATSVASGIYTPTTEHSKHQVLT